MLVRATATVSSSSNPCVLHVIGDKLYEVIRVSRDVGGRLVYWVACEDGKERNGPATRLRPLSPLELLALEAE